MSSLEHILTTAASGMSAESIRLNTISSNLANANSVSGDEASTYHAKTAEFSEVKDRIPGLSDADQPIGGVQVTKVSTSQKPLEKRYEPDNPLQVGCLFHVSHYRIQICDALVLALCKSVRYGCRKVIEVTNMQMHQAMEILVNAITAPKPKKMREAQFQVKELGGLFPAEVEFTLYPEDCLDEGAVSVHKVFLAGVEVDFNLLSQPACEEVTYGCIESLKGEA